MFDRIDDANRYLSRSIIRHKGEPVMISEALRVKRKDLLLVSNILDLETLIEIPMDSEDLDFSPVPLGYAMYEGRIGKKVGYLERNPVRKWKHGLHRVNSILRVDGRPYPLRFEGERDMKFVYDVIKGNYISFDQAIEEGMGAFSRTLAIVPGFHGEKRLHYRGIDVGAYDEDIKRLELSDNYFYLDRIVEEALQ